MRYAHIDTTGQVVNVSLWDGVSEYSVADELVLLDDDSPVSVGWTYDGSAFIAPPAEEVEE